jgi:hypothetical protein
MSLNTTGTARWVDICAGFRVAFGIFSTDADIRAIYQDDRSSYEAISALEQKIGFTMRPGASLVEILQNANASVERRSQQQHFCFEA